MTHYLQAFQPRENDPLNQLVAREEDFHINSITIKKSKEKVVSFSDVCKIIFGDGFLLQTLTPHEMNMHSLGERIARFTTRPFPAPSLIEFMAVVKELLIGRELMKPSEYSERFYNNGGISPAAFRVLQRYGDDVVLSSERTHFVGDVMLLGTFVQMAKDFSRFGDKTAFDLDFVGELSEARRAIEAEAEVISVFHENYRPMVLTTPYFDGQHWLPPTPVLLQPGDVVWNSNSEAMYLLNEFTIFDPKISKKSALPNRTFVKTTGSSCSATTLVGYGRNMHNILRCGRRAVFLTP